MRHILFCLCILLTLSGTVMAENTPTPTHNVIAPLDNPQSTSDDDRAVNTTAPSATFTVNSTLNIQDGNLGDGICDTFPGGTITCTLFAAIQEANQTTALDTINFNISGTGPHIFNVASGDDLGLPQITQDITIDGTSQSGASCPNVLNPADLRIVLDGGGNQAHGLRLGESADDSLIKGLVIINFATSGIQMNGADRVNIECNHIGVEADGTTPGSNGVGIRFSGDFADSDNTIIGGTTSNNRTQRNVISGNSSSGIYNNQYSDGSGSNGTIIRGNYIGTNALGTSAVPNGYGIWTRTQGGEIGGAQSYHANVISGNNSAGIRIGILTEDLLIDGNNIGTDVLGISAIANPNGIRIDPNDSPGDDPAPTSIAIGLLAPNRIAFNSENGIFVEADSDGGGEVSEVQWRTNRIYSNGQIGIDLGNNGVDANDVFDNDTGPNGYQNWPVLISAENSGRITGALPTKQSGSPLSYSIDVYEDTACDPSGNGEGRTYLDTFFMNGDGDIEPFDVFIDPLPSTGRFLSLIATSIDGSSEFGNCIEVDTATFVVDQANGGVNSNDINPGDGRCETNNNDCTLRAAIMEVNALGGDEPYNIYFDLGLTGLMTLGNSSAIPTINVPVNMDGIADNPDTRCPNSAGDFATLRVTLRGINLPAGSDMIVLGAGSGGSTIRGIAFVASQDSALHIGSDDNVVTCSWFGYGSNSAWNSGNSRAIDIVGDDNVIGGDSDAERNIIADSSAEGIRITSSATRNVVKGNYIGLNQTGSAANGNNVGVQITGGVTGNVIGGKFSSSRNVISGNTTQGVLIDSASHNNTIAGNIIGLDRLGSADLGNGNNGIRLDGVIGTTIGGSDLESRNVVSGNNNHGIYLTDAEDTTTIGNFIGTDVNGMSAVGNSLSGIRDDRGDGNAIGGATAADGNVIGGNIRNGIYLLGHTLFPTIQNNLVGFETGSGRATIGNGFFGIHIDSDGNAASTQATIADNTIAFNTRDGVRVDSLAVFTHLSANAIFENGWLGIDLDEDGANSPTVGVVITAADAETDKIVAAINAFANNQYRVDFFASDDCDPSDYGEGQLYLGSDTVTTNGSGEAEALVGSSLFDGGDAITATLTRINPAPDTSEFSACFVVEGGVPTAVRVSEQWAVGSERWSVVGLLLVVGLLSVGSVVVFGRYKQ